MRSFREAYLEFKGSIVLGGTYPQVQQGRMLLCEATNIMAHDMGCCANTVEGRYVGNYFVIWGKNSLGIELANFIGNVTDVGVSPFNNSYSLTLDQITILLDLYAMKQGINYEAARQAHNYSSLPVL